MARTHQTVRRRRRQAVDSDDDESETAVRRTVRHRAEDDSAGDTEVESSDDADDDFVDSWSSSESNSDMDEDREYDDGSDEFLNNAIAAAGDAAAGDDAVAAAVDTATKKETPQPSSHSAGGSGGGDDDDDDDDDDPSNDEDGKKEEGSDDNHMDAVASGSTNNNPRNDNEMSGTEQERLDRWYKFCAYKELEMEPSRFRQFTKEQIIAKRHTGNCEFCFAGGPVHDPCSHCPPRDGRRGKFVLLISSMTGKQFEPEEVAKKFFRPYTESLITDKEPRPIPEQQQQDARNVHYRWFSYCGCEKMYRIFEQVESLIVNYDKAYYEAGCKAVKEQIMEKKCELKALKIKKRMELKKLCKVQHAYKANLAGAKMELRNMQGNSAN